MKKKSEKEEGSFKPTVNSRLASNTTLLGQDCRDKVPRSCDHAILQNTSRPCSLGESFISSGGSLTIELLMTETNVLRQVLNITTKICSQRICAHYSISHRETKFFSNKSISSLFNHLYEISPTFFMKLVNLEYNTSNI